MVLSPFFRARRQSTGITLATQLALGRAAILPDLPAPPLRAASVVLTCAPSRSAPCHSLSAASFLNAPIRLEERLI